MTGIQQFDVEGIEVRQFEYEVGTVLAADFGAVDATVDIVGTTAIVVAGDEQYEFEVPEGAEVAINNGILTVEVGA